MLTLVLGFGLVWGAVMGPEPHIPPPPDGDPVAAQGALLYRVAGCVGCHSPPIDGAVHLGGGRDNPTMFGTFYAPNISPDPTFGIGGWTEEDFFRAMREGRAPDGRAYWPTFPTMAYTRLHDADIHALWVYLRGQAPVQTEVPEHEVKARYSVPGLLGFWRMVEFDSGEYEPDPARSETWNRGAYLVKAVAYCDQCHTPRGRTGFLQQRHYMAGGANPGKSELHPNLTPHPTAGIGRWSEADIVRFLSTGEKPGGGMADPTQVMVEKIRDSYAYFSDEDKQAIAVFLKALPPDDFDPYSHRW